jgi:hypothetical protein
VGGREEQLDYLKTLVQGTISRFRSGPQRVAAASMSAWLIRGPSTDDAWESKLAHHRLLGTVLAVAAFSLDLLTMTQQALGIRHDQFRHMDAFQTKDCPQRRVKYVVPYYPGSQFADQCPPAGSFAQ